MAGRGRAALLCYGFDRDVCEACLRQIAADQRGVMIAVRGAGHKAGRIVWEKFRERVRHVVREQVFLDAVPCVEQKTAARLYRSEEHTSELQSHVNLVCRLLLEKK